MRTQAPPPVREPALPGMGTPRRRGGILLILTALVLTVFAGRLIDLQAVRGDGLAAAALEQRLRTTVLPAQRGAILDSGGEPLALTVDARNVTADQTLVTDPAAVASALAPILDADPEVLQARLTGERRFVYIAKEVTPRLWDEIAALRLPGIFSETTSRRLYPAGDLAANVIGFVGAEGEGLGGLEYSMDALLAGKPGTQTYERGPGGRIIPTASRSTVPAEPGSSIRLTIDRDIQYVAQQAISEQVRKSRSVSGTVVVMDPATGQILALATAPTFDPNTAGSARQEDLGNRALSNAFEPGSTSKVMTIAAVVDQGKANPYSTFTVPGKLERGGKDFQDHTPHGTLHLTLTGIMAKSSNIGTILAAERIGGRALSQYLDKFGIGQPTGLNFPGENSGFVPGFRQWSATSFPTIAFGQGLSVNAVQAASVFATIANDGVRVEPSLVAGIVSADGREAAPPDPATTRVVSARTAREVREMLEAVVSDEGTAPLAGIPGYRVGGKTGTAQFVDTKCKCYNGEVIASFIGMAPIDDPKLVVAVILSQPQEGRFGGELAAPVFKTVMTQALQTRKVPPTGTRPPRLPITFKAK